MKRAPLPPPKCLAEFGCAASVAAEWAEKRRDVTLVSAALGTLPALGVTVVGVTVCLDVGPGQVSFTVLADREAAKFGLAKKLTEGAKVALKEAAKANAAQAGARTPRRGSFKGKGKG